ncbi:hypothetical protein EGR_08963 [Echinococcus granulosus]|uniref:Vezatin n=1 Tax=Echinococcus granulosus TaxID=6210 RepID=W6U4T6_ECHGR|nr:hypothetical protein EGR_08963 [Echinococcus granulosus]EUB56158.1 hypothetical protein EGR_08963 [Echinococcus granulosus]
MDEDQSVFPPNHPLRIYLRDLNLDDGNDCDGDDKDRASKPPVSIAPSDWTNSTSEYALLFNLLFYYYSLIIYFPKRYLLQCLLQSEHIFTNDRAYLEQCKGALRRWLPPHPLRPLSFIPILFTILPILLSLLVPNVNILVFYVGMLSFLLIVARLVFICFTVLLVKQAIGCMEDLHLFFEKSIIFLRGLNTVAIGYMFASRGAAFLSQLDRVVLPKYSSHLYNALSAYVSNVSSLSLTMNQIIQSSPSLVSSIVEIGSSLTIPHDTMTEGEANKKSLAMFCIGLGFDSELARVFGCFVALHSHESILLNLRVVKALCAWLWCLRRGRQRLREVDRMRVNLERGGWFRDEPPSRVTKAPSPAFEEVQVREHLSALASLHYNVISLSCRLHKLRERVIVKASSVALSELSSEDLQSMRTLLSNCQYCLDEAEKTLRDESTKSTESISVPKVPEPTFKVEGTGELIPLDSEQPPTEDECLEAIVDAEDLQAGGEESLYDDLDYLGQPVSKAEMKKRNADRAILLTELTSVIAHRMVETREREAKALSRSRGLLECNQSPSSPSLPPPAIDEVQSMSIVGRKESIRKKERKKYFYYYCGGELIFDNLKFNLVNLRRQKCIHLRHRDVRLKASLDAYQSDDGTSSRSQLVVRLSASTLAVVVMPGSQSRWPFLSNDEHDASRGEAPRGPSLDLKKRLQLRNQHFHLLIKTAEALSTQTRPDGTSHSLHVANPEGDGGVVATETLPEIFMRRPAISTDLKALILQQGRAVRSSKLEEEIFDDVGSGEELNEEELEEQ